MIAVGFPALGEVIGKLGQGLEHDGLGRHRIALRLILTEVGDQADLRPEPPCHLIHLYDMPRGGGASVGLVHEQD